MLDDLKAQYSDLFWHASLDVTDMPAVLTVGNEAFAARGHLDVIVNNVGYCLFGTAEDVSGEQIFTSSTPTSFARNAMQKSNV